VKNIPSTYQSEIPKKETVVNTEEDERNSVYEFEMLE